MIGSAWGRVLRAMLLGLVVLSMPVAAGAAGTEDAPAKVRNDDLPIPRDLQAEVGHYQVAGVALGAVAGALLGNFLSGGLMTPLLTAGWAGEGIGAAGTATGVEYGLSLIATAVTTSLGAFVGNWAAGGL